MSESIITAKGALATEPARLVGLVTTVVTSVLALLVALGLPISDELTVAILGLVAGVGPLVAGVIIRGRVYSPATTGKLVAAGIESGGRLMLQAQERSREIADEHGVGEDTSELT